MLIAFCTCIVQKRGKTQKGLIYNNRKGYAQCQDCGELYHKITKNGVTPRRR